MRFSDIIGQEQIKKKLAQTVLDHRVSHAQLFFGPEGNEKLALAIAYAQYINCQNRTTGENPDSCGACPSCIKYQKLIHPDLHFIYPIATTKKVTKKPKSIDFIEDWRSFLIQNDYHVTLHEWYEAIGIENKQGIINADDCMDIIHTLSYKSYESEYKVMILWMVEKLYYSAAPKILKILEEPPEKTLFILISEDPDQIISTIRSRTLLVKIPKIGLTDLVQYLTWKYGIEEREAGIIARRSYGNLKQALNRMQQVEEDQFNFTQFRNWMLLCYNNKIVDLVGFSGEIARIGRENQKAFLLYALKVVEYCTAVTFRTSEQVMAEGEELKFVHKIASFINPSNFGRFTELFNTALYHVERNAHPQTLFLDVSLKAVNLFREGQKK
ncbi:MAG: DNA polymerase III subunit delta [Bacteroidetes bacterium]|nr:DNA polymerase III subunit delta [Bacteroidota bacterium]